MLGTGLNALALTRFGGFHIFHGGRGGGFIWLILVIAVVGLIVWALTRAGRRAA